MMDVLDGVKSIIARQMSISKEDLTPETELREIGFMSIDAVDLLFALEDYFGIDVPFSSTDPGVAMSFKTVGGIAAAVSSELSSTARN